MGKLDSRALELVIAGAAVLLSTLGLLFGSYALAVVAVVAGAISFGILIGARRSVSGCDGIQPGSYDRSN
jgi:hypothetical protein